MAQTRSLRLLALGLLGLLPLPALATIVIGNPVHGDAWTPFGTPVDEMIAPIASVRAFACGGGSSVYPVGEEVDLVDPDGFLLPTGTWCAIDLVLDGPVAIRVGNELDSVEVSVIHLVEATPFTGYKLVVEGSQGGLVADVHD